jgi:hypothetical protein
MIKASDSHTKANLLANFLANLLENLAYIALEVQQISPAV